MAKTTDPKSAMQARHLAFISSFTTDVCHVEGKRNAVADALSRVEIDAVSLGVDFTDLAQAQQRDPELPAVRTAATALRWQDVDLQGATLLRHFGTFAPTVGTGPLPPAHLRAATRPSSPRNPGISLPGVQPLRVARAQLRRHRLGTCVRGLPAGEGSPPHRLRGRTDPNTGQPIRGDSRGPRGSPPTLARLHTPAHGRGQVHQVARSHPHDGHDHPGRGKGANRLLGLPLWDSGRHHLGPWASVRVPALDRHRPALGRRAPTDSRLPPPVQWDGRAVSPPAQCLTHRPAHRTQLGQPASVGPAGDPRHPQGGPQRIAGRVGLWDRAPPPGPVPGSGRGQPRSRTLPGGPQAGNGRTPAHPNSAPLANHASPNDNPRGTPHLPDGLRSPRWPPSPVVGPLRRSLPGVSEGGQVFSAFNLGNGKIRWRSTG